MLFSKLQPFLYFFQDPSTAFAYHLIYSHNIIHWYLLIILVFVYYAMVSVLRNYSWNINSKSRGFSRTLAFLPGMFYIIKFNILCSLNLLGYSVIFAIQKSWYYLSVILLLGTRYRARTPFYPEIAEFMRAFEKDWTEVFPRAKYIDPEDLTMREIDWPTTARHIHYYLKLEVNNFTHFLACFDYGSAKDNQYNFDMSYDELSFWVDWTHEKWLFSQLLDNYFLPLFSRKYGAHLQPHRAFLIVQKGNDSRRFEYICVFLPTAVVLAILSHSLSLLYSGTEEISPGMHFTAIGHQWFWSYELEALILTTDYSRITGETLTENIISLNTAFDSIPLSEASLPLGGKRLLEVDTALVLPVGVPLKALATSGDVLHSWAVPEMAIKIDAVPGRLNDSLSFIQRPGIFYGQCSELCGVGHGFMPIVVEALDVENFVYWLSSRQDS